MVCLLPALKREREREQGRGSVFPHTLLLPLDPEVAGTAEGLVDAGRDAGAVHLPLHAASQLLLLVSCLTGIPAPDQVRAVVAAAESCVKSGNIMIFIMLKSAVTTLFRKD